MDLEEEVLGDEHWSLGVLDFHLCCEGHHRDVNPVTSSDLVEVNRIVQ